jgi:DNA modification methylase
VILQGDALTRLRELPTGTVQCAITSPPYYGLRDYGTDVWEGGDPDCDHKLLSRGNPEAAARYLAKSTLVGTTKTQQGQQEPSYGQTCGKCGARRISPWVGGDPDCDHIKGEMRRGVNLAQSAHSTRGGAKKIAEVANIPYGLVCDKCGAQRAGQWTGGDPNCDHSMARQRTVGNAPSAKSTLTTNNGRGPQPGDKFHADQRREVTTECPCGARWTTSQLGLEATPGEYIERLVEVFREVRRVLRDDGTLWLNIGDSYANDTKWGGSSGGKHASALHGSTGIGRGRQHTGLKAKDLLGIPWMLAFALRDDGWYLRSDIIWAKPNPMPESVTDRPTSAHEHVFLLTKSSRYFYDAEAIREASSPDMVLRAEAGHTRGPNATRDPSRADADALVGGIAVQGDGRNKRNVWEIATQPFPQAHFATFPTKLVEPCVLAGSSRTACGVCGAPWQRQVERVATGYDGSRYGERAVEATGGALTGGTARSTLGSAGGTLTADYRTTGWEPSCDHRDDTGHCLVLDPFAGSGTVGVVSELRGREFIGIELNADYCAMAEQRIEVEGRGGKLRPPPEQIDGQMSLLP